MEWLQTLSEPDSDCGGQRTNVQCQLYSTMRQMLRAMRFVSVLCSYAGRKCETAQHARGASTFNFRPRGGGITWHVSSDSTPQSIFLGLKEVCTDQGNVKASAQYLRWVAFCCTAYTCIQIVSWQADALLHVATRQREREREKFFSVMSEVAHLHISGKVMDVEPFHDRS